MNFSSFNIKDLYNKVIGPKAHEYSYTPSLKPIFGIHIVIYMVGKGMVVTLEAIRTSVDPIKVAHPGKKMKSLAYIVGPNPLLPLRSLMTIKGPPRG